MGRLLNVIKKAGGTSLFKQYWRTGVLWTVTLELLILGKSNKALELIREIVSLKVQKRLSKKYAKELFRHNEKLLPNKEESRIIWIFWWQGIEEAPPLVKRCYNSVRENLSRWDVRLLTKDNYSNYVQFPDFILKKIDKGVISLTHLSDLLRLELLINHGGLWLDSTVLCTGSDIPNSIINSDLFVYQTQKPGSDGHPTIMSSWCMYAKTNNVILIETRRLLYAYWKNNTKMDDYFLLHHFFTIVCNQYPEETKKIPPFCNTVPHILLLHLFDEYDGEFWTDLKKMTCFHKLSYKLDDSKMNMTNTYYDIIINGNKYE